MIGSIMIKDIDINWYNLLFNNINKGTITGIKGGYNIIKIGNIIIDKIDFLIHKTIAKNKTVK